MHWQSGWKVPVAALLLAVGLVLGCGDEGEKVKKDDITGTWQATSVEYVARVGSNSVDLITLGATATLKLGADGSFEYVLTKAGAPPDTLRATWQLMGDVGDVMRCSPVGAPWYWAWDVAWSGNSLSLTGAGAEYDFDGDSVREEAEWNLAFTRAEAPARPGW